MFTTADADGPQAAARAAKEGYADAVFLNLLSMFKEQGRPVGPLSGITYAPACFAKEPRAKGMGKRELEAAMQCLLDSGRVRTVVTGSGARERTRLEVAE